MLDQSFSSQTHGEAKPIWALPKQTFTAAKAWIKRRSGERLSINHQHTAEQLGNVGPNGHTVHSLTLAPPVHETPDRVPYGNDPSPERAVEDQGPISRRNSVGSAYSIATVANNSDETAQVSFPAPNPDSDDEDDQAIEHQGGHGSLFGDIVRRLSGNSLIPAEEDLELAIILVRNPASRLSAESNRSPSPFRSLAPTLTSLIPTTTLVEEPVLQAKDDTVEGQGQVKRKFHVESIVGTIACIVSVVGAVATTYASFHG